MADGTKLDTLYWELQVRIARAQAEQEARVAGIAAGSSFDEGFDAGDKGRKGAADFVASLVRDLKTRREDIKREAVAGLITPEEAAAAGRAASKSFVQELRGGLNQLRDAGVISTSDLPALLNQGSSAMKLQREEAERLAHQLNNTSSVYDKLSRSVYQQAYAMDAARKTSSVYATLSRQVYVEAYRMNDSFNKVQATTANVGGAFTKLRGPLTSLAIGTLGANANVGRLVSTLSLLGAGAALTIGITAGIAAIAFAYNKITEGAKKARAEIDRVIEGLQQQINTQFRASRQGQLAAEDAALLREIEAQEALRKARAGTKVFNPDTEQTTTIIDAAAIAKAEADLAEATARTIRAGINIAEASASAEEKRTAALGRALEAGKANNDIVTEAARLTKQYNAELTDLLAKSKPGDDASLQRIAALRGMIDNLTAADRASAKAAERAEKDFDKIRAKIPRSISAPDDPIAASAKLTDEARRALVAATTTAVDDLGLEIEDLREKFKNASGEGRVFADRLIEIKEAQRGLAQSGEALTARMERYEELFGISGNAIRLVASLNTEKGNLEANLRGAKTDEQRRAIKAQILEIDERIAEAVDAAADSNARAAEAAKDVEITTAQVAGGIADAANVAFGLASAFLGVDSNVTKVLGSIGQLAGGIESALTATTALGRLSGIGAAIGGGLALANTLFGKSPEEKARLERIRENTEALRKLTDRVGTLSQVNVSGSSLAIASSILNDPALNDRAINRRALESLNRNGSGTGLQAEQERQRRRALDEAIARNGISLEEFNDILAGLGVELGKGRISAQDFETAVKALNEAAIVRFGSSFAGQMEQLNAAIQIFPDLTSPIRQFDEFRKALERIKNGGGVLSRVLADFDLSTAQGLAAAQKAIEEIFKQFTDGTIKGADLGGLTPEEFLDVILRAKGFIDAALEERKSESKGTGGFSIDRSVTEVTASRIGAYLSNVDRWTMQTASHTAQIVALLGGSPRVPPVGAPSIPSGGTSGPGGTVVTFADGAIRIIVSGAVPDPVGTGTKLGDAFVKRIDEELGAKQFRTARSQGSVVLKA